MVTMMRKCSDNTYESMGVLSKYHDKKKKDGSQKSADVRGQNLQIQHLIRNITKRGVHSVSYLSAAGFQYTGEGDTTRCHDCGLEVSKWTLDMKPFDIHSTQKPNCSFVHSVKTSILSNTHSSFVTTSPSRRQSLSNEQENPSKRQKVETIDSKALSNTLVETDLLQQGRRRSFSPLATSYQSIN